MSSIHSPSSLTFSLLASLSLTLSVPCSVCFMCGCVFISFPVSFSFFFDFCLSSSSLGNCRYPPVCCCLFLNLLREKDAVVVKVWPLCVYARTYMCIVDVSRGFNLHGVGCTALHADNRNFPIGFSRVETLSFAIERRKNILHQSTFYFFFLSFFEFMSR